MKIRSQTTNHSSNFSGQKHFNTFWEITLQSARRGKQVIENHIVHTELGIPNWNFQQVNFAHKFEILLQSLFQSVLIVEEETAFSNSIHKVNSLPQLKLLDI